MECMFKGLKNKNCGSGFRCAGIKQAILSMGGSADFAEGFGKYVYRAAFLNKLNDIFYEAKRNYYMGNGNIPTKLRYIFWGGIVHLGAKITGDGYGILKHYNKLQHRVFDYEIAPYSNDPMVYFSKVGDGYGFFFKCAAIGSNQSQRVTELIFEYGKRVGILVSLRDAVKDFSSDIRRGKFNPFVGMPRGEIMEFFKLRTEEIKKEVLTIHNDLLALLDIPSEELGLKIPSGNVEDGKPVKDNRKSVFDSLLRYSLQSQSFCAKCSRSMLMTPTESTPTKVIAGMLGSFFAVLTLKSMCGAASGVTPIQGVLLQDDSNCCDRCCQNICESMCQSCCDSCSDSCSDACSCDNCTCQSGACTCEDGSCTCS